MSCCAAPAATLAVDGETAIDVTVTAAAVTVSVAEPVTPLIVAVIAVLPALTPVATPSSLSVATAELDEAQATEDVSFAVDPSL
jgi:hypothetical protein